MADKDKPKWPIDQRAQEMARDAKLPGYPEKLKDYCKPLKSKYPSK
jgi:hypothetical protein